MSPAHRSGVAALALSGVLAGCGRPDFSEAPVSTPPVTSAPAPPLPAWVGPMLGRGVRDLFPAVALCQGNADGVDLRYEGSPSASRVIGWAWDLERKTPPPRIVLADKDFRIVGGGDTGVARPDVIRALPGITSSATGWRAQTANIGGPIYVFGADLGRRACKIGRLDL